jgi:hypothetical protein
MLEAEERLGRLHLPFTPAEIVAISYAQSLVIRKYTLELLARRAGIGGYIITGLRDTPISTSGVWDDLGRLKWSPEQFLPINGEAVLSLDIPRRRRWHRGGDRPERLDAYNLWAGENWQWHVILKTTSQSVSASSRLSWKLSDGDGVTLSEGQAPLIQEVLPGRPGHVGTISVRLPPGEKASQLRLRQRSRLRELPGGRGVSRIAGRYGSTRIRQTCLQTWLFMTRKGFWKRRRKHVFTG